MDKPDFDGGNDMLQWMLTERVKKSFHDQDYRYLAQFQLQLAFAAIHTTSMAATNMLYDLVAYPKYTRSFARKFSKNWQIITDLGKDNS